MKRNRLSIALSLALEVVLSATTAAEPYEFKAGYPTLETSQRLYDELDYLYAVQAYLWATPLLNSWGTWKAIAAHGIAKGELAILVMDRQAQPQHMVMTLSGPGVYGWAHLLDLSKTGPLVVDYPPVLTGIGVGHIYDMFQRILSDMGTIGPDKGQGGKYLILPRDYNGEEPPGYHLVRGTTDHVNIYYGLVTPEGGLEGGKQAVMALRLYPLTERDNPRPNRFVMVGDKPFNADWPKDEQFFEWLSEVVQEETFGPEERIITTNLARLGIEKGKAFNPDARTRAILQRAAAMGYDQVRNLAYHIGPRNPSTKVYPDRQWEFIMRSAPLHRTDKYEQIDERAGSSYQLVGNAVSVPQVIDSKPVGDLASGPGQYSLMNYRDAAGEYLNGSHTYLLRMQTTVPVAQFWEMTVYDVETRRPIDTGEKKASLASTQDLIKNPNGSIDLYFGPEAPAGMEKNWVKTIPDKGWFTCLGLYGLLEPILNKTWKPNDFEKMK